MNEVITNPGSDELIRDRAKSLFGFLKALCQSRSKAIYDLDSYDRILWLGDIPSKPGCISITNHIGEESEDVDTWISIKKPKLRSYPKPPSELEPWLYPEQLDDSTNDIPDLRERIIVPHPEVETEDGEKDDSEYEELDIRTLENNPHIKDLHDEYVENKWWPWRDEDLEIRPVQDIYDSLFFIYQRQQATGEQYEIVLGYGLLEWKINRRNIYRHIIACQVDVKFDSRKGELTVEPASEGLRTKIEDEFIPPNARPDIEVVENINNQLLEADEDFWHAPTVRIATEQWGNELSGSSIIVKSIKKPDRDTREQPRVSFSPALILRRRTDRALIQMFDQILNELRTGNEIPPAVTRYLTVGNEPASDDVDQEEEQTGSASPAFTELDEEIYFPLEANSEQAKIINRLSSSDGVLVQGPPGTGKSHTIVNLICHLLAMKQRVLVTSQAPRALKVLRDFIKEDVPSVAPLAVVQLGADRESIEAMEQSVTGITGRQNDWDPEEYARSIRNNEETLDEVRRDQAQILQRLFELRQGESHTYERVFSRYSGTHAQIATSIKQDSEHYDWFQDEIELDIAAGTEEIPAPLNSDEATELIELLVDELGNRASTKIEDPIDTRGLPTVSTITDLFAEESKRKVLIDHNQTGLTHVDYPRLLRLAPGSLISFSGNIGRLTSGYQDIASGVIDWTEKCISEILADKDRHWKTLLERTQQEILEAGSLIEKVGNAQVTGLTEDLKRTQADAENLIKHLELGKGLGFGPFRAKIVKETEYLHKSVRFEGHALTTVDVVQKFLHWVHLRIKLDELESRWKPFGAVLSEEVDSKLDEYRDFCEPIEKSFELLDLKRAIQADCQRLIFPEPTWHDHSALSELHIATLLAIANQTISNTQEEINKITRDLDEHKLGATGSYKTRLRKSITERDREQLIGVWEEIENDNSLRIKQARKSELLDKLGQAAPNFSKELSDNHCDETWSLRVGQVQDLWNHKCALSWLQKTIEPGVELQLRQNLNDLKQKERRILGETASLKAWEGCFSRMTDEQRQNLIAWKNATKRVGKGTGKYAPRHRKAAKEHMEGCRSAIPAWVMPIHRVAEFIQPGKDMFDVVIVDEASQSGLEALFLTYVAKKVIVVGDDKQISPQSFANREDVEQLRQQHIRTLPHSQEYDVDTSLFDMTEIRYKGRIRLREHFRCMPEIIQFSNKLCYEGEPLIPLKQYGVGRLEPVVETIFVEEGYIKGQRTKVNPPEAAAVVAKISSLCKDPVYEGKTFGVISLLGSAQAHQIENKLLNEIGSQEIEDRKLVCGDAYSFQGDERDVMFLSMVSARPSGPNQRIGALTRPADQRRFNVAASRAKEQLILFHSVELGDLSKSCVRYKLLEYCKNPSVEQSEIEGIPINDIRYRAKEADRQTEIPPPPFDSWFEVDVFLDVTNRGYRVIPQHKIANYSIDLLVQGMKGQLAVECDGDAFHGPDQYDADLVRQTQLERCGLTFFRIRESSYRFDKTEPLDKLWRLLEKNGIYPRGAENSPSESIESTSLDQNVAIDHRLPASVAAESNIEEVDGSVQVVEAKFDESQVGFKHENSAGDAQIDFAGDQQHHVRKSSEGIDYSATRQSDLYRICDAADALNVTDLIDQNQFFEVSYRKIIKQMAEYVVEQEGPILEELLSTRIARAHDYGRTGSKIRKQISSAIRRSFNTTKEPITGAVCYWPNKYTPEEWSIFRAAESEDDFRAVDKIPLTELAVLIRQVISEDVDDPLKRIADLMGIRRLRQSARTHLQKAFDVVSSGEDIF